MRVPVLFASALLLTAALTSAAERTWKTGTWAFPPHDRVYVIESATEFITGEAPEPNASTVAASAGDAVQYAVEQRTLVVLGADKTEHVLRLVSSTPKYSSDYAALGGGHYIKTVSPGGARVTLEDGSRWDVDARVRFAVAEWEPDDLISVRRSNDDDAFVFEIDNTSRDDGALSNHLAR
jgi:hypothetical protein